MSGPIVVALDGPAGSGKSSVSRETARRLGWAFLDTGAAYRSLAWHVLERGGDTADESLVLSALDDFDLLISLDPAAPWVRVGDAEVSAAIREPRVTAAVGGVARIGFVRTSVNALFRRLIDESDAVGIVVEGRDITTVVAPDAAVRVLLTADPAVRAARRGAELGTDASVVADALARRDAHDGRVVDFSTPAEGVDLLDSTDLDFDQTVAALLEVIRVRTEATDAR